MTTSAHLSGPLSAVPPPEVPSPAVLPGGALPRTAVVTLVAGRHRHLAAQLAGLARGSAAPDVHVVAAMGDSGVASVVAAAGLPWATEVVDVDVPASGELPLAGARNAAAARALAAGAELLVLLDVDCIPGPALLERYRGAAVRLGLTGGGTAGSGDAGDAGDPPAAGGPVLLSGPVSYLPPLLPGQDGYPLDGLDALAPPHPARPAPADGELLRGDDLMLFWSLSFAITARDWARTGGFCEEYVGYGGEDTDVAATVGRLGGALWWVGGAVAHHQHHPVESPPVRHLDAVLRNAAVFHARWGWFPMEGWLEAFAARGLAHRDAAGAWVRGPASSR